MARQESGIPFDRSLLGPAGQLVRLSPLVRRMVAGNPGPMTFTGTCTYVIGNGEVAVIDPGPNDPGHIAALLAALRGETIGAILVTHSHKDHASAARTLKAAAGARIVGCAPNYSPGGPLDATHDSAYAPDTIMQEGDALESKNFALVCLATPGHTRNHLAFVLPQESALFSGDHVMAWSTSIVAPPDGVMRQYMASLDRLLARNDRIYWPGHGSPVTEPPAFLRALIRHRREREEAIFSCIKAGHSTISAIVASVYDGIDPVLANAAAHSVIAHIEDLVERGLVEPEGAPGFAGIYRAA